MSLGEIEAAKRKAVRAKAELDRSLAVVQHRLAPGTLAGEAWDGVKEKSADLAEGALEAVKSRPKAVSIALGAFALFLARAPIKRAVTRLISSDDEDDGNDGEDAELSVTEGVS